MAMGVCSCINQEGVSWVRSRLFGTAAISGRTDLHFPTGLCKDHLHELRTNKGSQYTGSHELVMPL